MKVSKSRPVLKVKTPPEVILKRALSAPPVILKVGVSPSTSVAVTVATVVWFSALEATGVGYDGLVRYYSLEASTNLLENLWMDVPGYSDILGQNQVVIYTNQTGRAIHYRSSTRLE